MANIDTLILKLLRAAKRTKKKSRSTYAIAKKIGISWSTANIHCYKLKSEGKIRGEMECAKIGQSKRIMWWIT